ncbi:hypothetical protein LUZ60_016605 [Juncus effusus]|nr:hypothetical protein LUZ60_016605 [Juncus effusus]
MGLCFSKKKKPCSDPASDSNGKKGGKDKVKKKESKKESAVVAPKRVTEPPVCEKKPVFVVTQNTNKPTASDEKENKKSDAAVPSKKPQINKQESETKPAGTAPPAEEIRAVPVRTSSCTKEEVDAILIQCGRLSRSSSGKTSAETGTHNRRYSGSKRSYDFDHEKRGEEDEEERTLSRPSPHRRTPSRERSGSRERTTGTGRRVSRSPGRRSDGPTNSTPANEKPKPAKMVTVPAREKAGSAKTGTGTGSGKRNASPRSRSPGVNGANRSENVGTLSRSSSRKGEHSPFRRNPMAELDENSMKATQSGFKSQKTNQAQSNKNESVISSRKGSTEEITKSHTVVTNCIRDQFVTCRVKDQDGKKAEEHFDPLGSFKSNEINFTNISVESFNSKSHVSTNRSSRRSSRDFDHQNPNSYTNLLLEDIQNYHQTKNPNPNPNSVPFSLPACVSKACSILEAVADLNSSSSNSKQGFSPKEPFLESEIMVKDDLMEPSMHKYVSVRDLGGEVEPQESAGSNSFVGGQSQTWEPNSVDSTDRWARSQSNNGDEAELERPVGSNRQSGVDRRLGKKREGVVDRQIYRNGGSGRSGSRVTGGSAC